MSCVSNYPISVPVQSTKQNSVPMSLVVDIGSYSVKFGEAGQETPTEFRTTLKRPRFNSWVFGSLCESQQDQLQKQNGGERREEKFILDEELAGLYESRPLFLDNGRLGNVEDIF